MVTTTTSFATIDCNDFSQSGPLLKQYGVVVVENVFTDKQCDTWMDNIVTTFEKIGNNVSRDKPESWIKSNLPPQTRYGLFQSCMAHLPSVWEVRTSNQFKKIFQSAYSHLRDKEISEFVCSYDAINVQQNVAKKSNKDWPHLDQTTRNDVYECIQGQAILTNTTACFRATPKSHLYFKEILDMCNVDNNDHSNWIRFPDKLVPKIKKYIENKGLEWQIPIRAKKGSCIFWLSSTAHSAIPVSKKLSPTLDDPFRGWRGVVYVCYRPYNELADKEHAKRITLVRDNRTTNHWSTKIFPILSRGIPKHKYSPPIINLINDPTLVYKHLDLNDDYFNNEEFIKIIV